MRRREQTKGFCQVKKKSKNLRKTREVGGWVKPQLGFFFFWKFCVFCVVLLAVLVSPQKKKMDMGVDGWSGQSEFFSDFLIFFNLTRPLRHL